MSIRELLLKPFNLETAEADLFEIQKERKKIAREIRLMTIGGIIIISIILYAIWLN